MRPPSHPEEPFPTQEALDHMEDLRKNLDRAVSEMRDLRDRFIALAEREAVSAESLRYNGARPGTHPERRRPSASRPPSAITADSVFPRR